ncbi:MAG TPA: hypothetical protein VKY74_20870, partial [Chloroflexia bacterium]|nr:hypothetical protein [Chloroflexia bacterium]
MVDQEARSMIRAAPPAAARWPWGLFGVFLGIYLLTLRGHLGSRDEEALYMTTVMLEKHAEALLQL